MRPPAHDEHPLPDGGEGERLAHLRLRLPAPGCSECLRVAQAALGGIEGVLVVEALPGGGAISVTYDAGLVDPADLRAASQPAGRTNT